MTENTPDKEGVQPSSSSASSDLPGLPSSLAGQSDAKEEAENPVNTELSSSSVSNSMPISALQADPDPQDAAIQKEQAAKNAPQMKEELTDLLKKLIKYNMASETDKAVVFLEIGKRLIQLMPTIHAENNTHRIAAIMSILKILGNNDDMGIKKSHVNTIIKVSSLSGVEKYPQLGWKNLVKLHDFGTKKTPINISEFLPRLYTKPEYIPTKDDVDIDTFHEKLKVYEEYLRYKKICKFKDTQVNFHLFEEAYNACVPFHDKTFQELLILSADKTHSRQDTIIKNYMSRSFNLLPQRIEDSGKPEPKFDTRKAISDLQWDLRSRLTGVAHTTHIPLEDIERLIITTIDYLLDTKIAMHYYRQFKANEKDDAFTPEDLPADNSLPKETLKRIYTHIQDKIGDKL